MQLKSLARRHVREILINIKVSEAEAEVLEKKAAEYAGKNRSEWIRYAALNFKPKTRDLISESAAGA